MKLQTALALFKKLINKKTILALVVVALVLFVGNRNAQDASKISTYTVEPKTFESAVVSSGKIKAKQSTDLHFQTAGQLAWINVKRGDYVARGQAIAGLNTQVLEKQLKEDLNTYLKSRSTFDETAQNNKDQPITDAIKRLAERNQADLNSTVLDVEIQDLAIRFATITSPIDGYVVAEPKFYPGSNILITDTIATVSTSHDLEFEAETDETDIGKVREGQTAKISLDAYPDNTFDSKVSEISPEAVTTSTGATAFDIELPITTNEQLLIGMNGSAEVVTQTKENVLAVPQEAIVDENAVWVKKGFNYEKKQIGKGLESDAEVEVTSGLSTGDEIVTSGFDELQKGSLFQKIKRSVFK